MTTLVTCPDCNRHIRRNEAACPFCGASVASRSVGVPERAAPSGRLGRAALFAFATASVGAAACSGSTFESSGKEPDVAAGGATSAGGKSSSSGATSTGGAYGKAGAASSGGATSSGGARNTGGTRSAGGTSSGGTANRGGDGGGFVALYGGPFPVDSGVADGGGEGGTASTGGTKGAGGTTSAGGTHAAGGVTAAGGKGIGGGGRV